MTARSDAGLMRRSLFRAGAASAAAGLIGGEALAAAPTPTPGDIHLPARTVPPPTTISAEAQAYLRRGAMQPPPPKPPAVGDREGWHRYVAESERGFPAEAILKMPGIEVKTRTLGGVTCTSPRRRTWAKPSVARCTSTSMAAAGCSSEAAPRWRLKIAAWQYDRVACAVDHRMPPDHPYPAALDDCVAAYRALLARHGAANLLVSGGSAGGNLAAALMLRARAEHLQRPAALVLDTPVTDLTNAGDSWTVLEGLDPVLRDAGGVASTALYLGGHDPRDPYLSPLFGDLAGFPPTYLRSGTRDRLLSDTVRMHAKLRAAGVAADLFVGEAMPHTGFGGMTPEDNAALTDLRRWLAVHWRGDAPRSNHG